MPQAALFTDFVTVASLLAVNVMQTAAVITVLMDAGRHTVGHYICPPSFPVCGSDISTPDSTERMTVLTDHLQL